MTKFLRGSRVRAVQEKALAKTGRVRVLETRKGPRLSRTVEWDIAGNCLNPQNTVLRSRPETKNSASRVVAKSDEVRIADLQVACRRCEKCLARREAHWRLRALYECGLGIRTWMVTLTLDPSELAHALAICRVNMKCQGLDYDELPEEDRFQQLDRVFYAKFQKRLKLLRKAGPEFRYLAVTEVHNGEGVYADMRVPHWHVLFHETNPSKPLRYDLDWKGSWKREIGPDGKTRAVPIAHSKDWRPFWPYGFWEAKLKPADEATYVCKYLSKDMLARVRASIGYGNGNVIDGTFTRETPPVRDEGPMAEGEISPQNKGENNS